MSRPASHLDLLAIARSVRRAAVNDDAERLRTELARLDMELTDHVDSERAALDALPGSAADVAGSGQQRLLRLVSEVLGDVTATDDDCNCLVRAAEIDVALRRQAMLARGYHPGATPREGSS